MTINGNVGYLFLFYFIDKNMFCRVEGKREAFHEKDASFNILDQKLKKFKNEKSQNKKN